MKMSTTVIEKVLDSVYIQLLIFAIIVLIFKFAFVNYPSAQSIKRMIQKECNIHLDRKTEKDNTTLSALQEGLERMNSGVARDINKLEDKIRHLFASHETLRTSVRGDIEAWNPINTKPKLTTTATATTSTTSD